MSLEQQQKLNFLSEDFDPLLALTTPGGVAVCLLCYGYRRFLLIVRVFGFHRLMLRTSTSSEERGHS